MNTDRTKNRFGSFLKNKNYFYSLAGGVIFNFDATLDSNLSVIELPLSQSFLRRDYDNQLQIEDCHLSDEMYLSRRFQMKGFLWRAACIHSFIENCE